MDISDRLRQLTPEQLKELAELIAELLAQQAAAANSDR